MRSILIIVISATLLLSGCASGPRTLKYDSGIKMNISGAVTIGEFEYLPSKNNQVKPNQIKNTALNDIMLPREVAEYFAYALAEEAKHVGIKLDNSKTVVSGQIIEYLADDLGFSADWTIAVNYIIKKQNEPNNCYNKTHKVKFNFSKSGYVVDQIRKSVRRIIVEAFYDKDFVNCIQPQSKS